MHSSTASTSSTISRVRVSVAIALAVVCTALLIVGAPTVTSAADVAVTINNFAFTPGTITVPVGTRVVWTNQQGGVSHTTTSDTNVWDSGPLTTGQSFAFTFTQPGTFPYHCAIHPGMHGTVIVSAAAVTAPVAADDAYTLITGTTLTAPAATGVLVNDTPGAPAATISASTQPAFGSATLNAADGSFVYTPMAGYVGADAFTYTLTNSAGSSTATVSLTVNAATLIGLTVTAPAANGGTTPIMVPGGKMLLTTTGIYNNGATGPVSGLSYTSSNPDIAGVSLTTGLVTALIPGQTTMIVTGPNGTHATITVRVAAATGSGLVPPGVQPMLHATAPPPERAAAPPAPQPATHPAGTSSGGGVQPQAAGQPLATPLPQPARH